MSETIVIAEMNNNTIHPSTAELVAAACALGAEPTLVVPCTDAGAADSAASWAGISSLIAAKSTAFENYDAAGWASALDAVMPQGTIVTGASPQSKDLAARIAARRNLPVVQDVVKIDGNQVTSPVYSGKAMQTVALGSASVVSVRFNVFAPVQEGGQNSVSVVDTTGDVATSVQEFMARASERLDVSEANIVISADEVWVHLTTSVTLKPLQTPLGLQSEHHALQSIHGKRSPTQCRSVRQEKQSTLTSTSQSASLEPSNTSLECVPPVTLSPSTKMLTHQFSSTLITELLRPGRKHFQFYKLSSSQ